MNNNDEIELKILVFMCLKFKFSFRFINQNSETLAKLNSITFQHGRLNHPGMYFSIPEKQQLD